MTHSPELNQNQEHISESEMLKMIADETAAVVALKEMIITKYGDVLRDAETLVEDPADDDLFGEEKMQKALEEDVDRKITRAVNDLGIDEE